MSVTEGRNGKEALLEAARIGDDQAAEQLVAQGVDVNVRDFRTCLTALHYAAGCGAWAFIRVLEKIPKLDYLQKDRRDRLPSALAFEVAKDQELGEYLLEKEVAQAQERDIDYHILFSSSRDDRTVEGFKVGDFVVYPTHGIGQVEGIENRQISGISVSMMRISFPDERMTLRVPAAKTKKSGVRHLRDADAAFLTLHVLRSRYRRSAASLSREEQNQVTSLFNARLKTGKPIAVAEIMQALDLPPDTSFTKAKLYQAAVERLADYIAATGTVAKSQAEELIQAILKEAA